MKKLKRSLAAIDEAIAEKRSLLDGDEHLGEIDAIEAEIDALLEERAAATTATEKRGALLARIATGTAGEERRNANTTNEQDETSDDPLGTPEYRSAFAKSMRGMKLTAKEQRAFDIANEMRSMTTGSGSAGPAIPTHLNEQIIQKVKQIAPMIDEITLLRVNGPVSLVVEGTIADATVHTEGATITSDNDTLVKVDLSAYEITKLVSISKAAQIMTMAGFETWLVDMIAKRLARKIENWIINGTGSGMPKGIAVANTWVESTNMITVAATASLTTTNVNAVIALLNGEYDPTSKFVMSKKTLFTDFMPLQDNSKNAIVTKEGKTYFVQGYEVRLTDEVTLHEAYLGSLPEYYGNLSQDITVEVDNSSGFRQRMIDYLGSAMFDGAPAVGDAFVKLAKATATS